MLIELLSRTSNIPESKLISLALTASRRYKVYSIPKRTGGERLIEHPSRELKAIQRWIVLALVARFPVHEAATAYRRGVGIRENAERHRTTRFTVRFDFSNFFPSFSERNVCAYVEAESRKIGLDLNSRDVTFIGNILCRNGRITIGAPSSPAITNAMMFEFDRKMYEECQSRGLVFTRYADDIFVSSFHPNQLGEVEGLIRNIKREIPYLRLRLNRQKTVFLSRKYKRAITGVIVTPQQYLSVGRDRKREIKALIHRWLEGNIDVEKFYYLKGLFSYAIDIEPQFEDALARKYGDAPIKLLRTADFEFPVALI